jgi:hypothetical protein
VEAGCRRRFADALLLKNIGLLQRLHEPHYTPARAFEKGRKLGSGIAAPILQASGPRGEIG